MHLLVIDKRWSKVIKYDELLIMKSSVLLNLEGYSAKSGIFFRIFKNDIVVIFVRELIGVS